MMPLFPRRRAVDELYYLCEAEGSATHCTEAAELLEG